MPEPAVFTLDAYAARSCALKTHHAHHPGLTRPEPSAPTTRMPGSSEFTETTLAAILAGRASVADLRELAGRPSPEQQDACAKAIADGVEVILGGMLPRQLEQHRHGRADLLVRDPAGGYHPGVLKYQRVLDPRNDEYRFSYSRLADLPDRAQGTGWRYRWHWRWQNALQLAHLWQLLAAAGWSAASGPWGLVVGTDALADIGPVATWLDLTEPVVPAPPEQIAADGPSSVTALQRYAHDFALRVELAEQAQAAGPDDPLPLPVVSHECSYCSWWPVCRPLLDDDDLGLRISKSPLDAHEITVLRAAGVTTVTQLAEADLDHLLPTYLPQVSHRQGAEDRLRLAQRRSRLLSGGALLDRLTSGPIPLPSAAVEIDIDVETSRDDRVYLWGFWCCDGVHEPYYQAFSSFSDLDADGERDLARTAMAWLRGQCEGRDAAVYHYSDYEVVRLRRLTTPQDDTLSWAADFAAAGFVDLFAVMRAHFFGANGLGLKVVASAGPGFHWRDEDPGGLNSMTWFDDAVHADSAAVRDAARHRVLDYNEDDVKATWALRRWLREQN